MIALSTLHIPHAHLEKSEETKSFFNETTFWVDLILSDLKPIFPKREEQSKHFFGVKWVFTMFLTMARDVVRELHHKLKGWSGKLERQCQLILTKTLRSFKGEFSQLLSLSLLSLQPNALLLTQITGSYNVKSWQIWKSKPVFLEIAQVHSQRGCCEEQWPGCM